MKKEVQAKILTAVLVAGVAAFVIAQRTGWDPAESAGRSLLSSKPRKEAEPRETIYAMLDAARDGEVEAYLDCYIGDTARRLAQSRDEMTAEAFGEYLRNRNREIKGIAINEAEKASEGKVRIRVEYVYADRNEAQQFYLVRQGGEWKITGMDPAERVETLVPYGTPVY